MTTTTVNTARVLDEVLAERKRQDERWGEQNHSDGTSHVWAAKAYAVKVGNDARTPAGRISWFDILREEVYEAFAETDPVLLRAELIQVAAVAGAWVEAIDRRTA